MISLRIKGGGTSHRGTPAGARGQIGRGRESARVGGSVDAKPVFQLGGEFIGRGFDCWAQLAEVGADVTRRLPFEKKSKHANRLVSCDNIGYFGYSQHIIFLGIIGVPLSPAIIHTLRQIADLPVFVHIALVDDRFGFAKGPHLGGHPAIIIASDRQHRPPEMPDKHAGHGDALDEGVGHAASGTAISAIFTAPPVSVTIVLARASVMFCNPLRMRDIEPVLILQRTAKASAVSSQFERYSLIVMKYNLHWV